MIRKNLILISLLGILSSSGTNLNISTHLKSYQLEYGRVEVEKNIKTMEVLNGNSFVIEDGSFTEGEEALFLTIGGDSYLIKKWREK